MKQIFKKIVVKILELEARAVLFLHRPKIIAITGSVGKTTTKDAIYEALKNKLSVRKNQKSMNSEIGVPLTILNLKNGWDNPWMWLKILAQGFGRIFYFKNFPKWLVLETGIDRPNDMKNLMRWLKPKIAVVTAFGKVPVHVEYFDSIEQVIHEKSLLAFAIRDGGAVILNADDDQVLKLKSKLEVPTYTYSIHNKSDVYATNYSIDYDAEHKPVGIVFKANFNGNTVPINIRGAIGEPLVYSALPALAVAMAIGVPAVDAGQGLLDYKPTPGRMNILPAINGATLIDDSYNASPVATESALATLHQIKTKGKKIFAFGDMLELGRFSASEHRKIGTMAAQAGVDIFVTVGFRSELSAEEAVVAGMNGDNVYNFRKSEEAASFIKNFIEPNDIILVKGSQGMRMEKISRLILKEDLDPAEFLVRQEKEWLIK